MGNGVYFIGIKGTGMCALAELYHREGVPVSGSDVADTFYTDAILRSLGIPYYEGFDGAHVPQDAALVVYSAAYSAEHNPEVALCAERAASGGPPLVKYPDALGAYSARFDSSGIAGVHGKTTTTVLAGIMLRAAALPATILAGSASAAFGGRSTLYIEGEPLPCPAPRLFVAETCEYRRHFLAFHPRRIVLTAVESDHQDCFPTYESIRDAFVEYVQKLPPDGDLIYCADDPGAREVVARLIKEGEAKEREASSSLRSQAALENRPCFSPTPSAGKPKDARRLPALIPYGFTADGPYRITSYRVENERALFTLRGFPGAFPLRVPGRHTALDAAGALALTASLAAERGRPLDAQKLEAIRKEMVSFAGSARRSEILGERAGVLYMDDYGHHPTAIRATLAGLRAFYPERRLVVSFMSHTYTRTAALLDQFAAAFDDADVLFLHKIYASAREEYAGGVTGRTLYEKAREHAAGITGGQPLRADSVHYVEEPLESAPLLRSLLRSGDLFLTLGAGDNWKLGRVLFFEKS